MNVLKSIPILLLALMSLLFSCSKENDALQEEVLLSNEIREKDGLRFILTWAINDGSVPQNNAQFDLELYKGIGTSKSTKPINLIPKPDYFVNYSIVTDSLADQQSYTLTINYGTITKDGTFELYVEGYTAGANTKKFTLPHNTFTTLNANTKRDFLKIKKEGTKYTFTLL